MKGSPFFDARKGQEGRFDRAGNRAARGVTESRTPMLPEQSPVLAAEGLSTLGRYICRRFRARDTLDFLFIVHRNANEEGKSSAAGRGLVRAAARALVQPVHYRDKEIRRNPRKFFELRRDRARAPLDIPRSGLDREIAIREIHIRSTRYGL